jgi:uncharacterized protein
MILSRDQILQILQDNANLIRSFGVRRLGLFGSCARGDSVDSSDLDFVVDFESKSFDAYMDLKAFLEKLFACRVDLVLADAIKPRLSDAIRQEAVYAPGL